MSFTTVFRPRTRTSTPRPLGAQRDGVRTTLHLKSDAPAQANSLAAEAAAFTAKRPNV